METVSAPPRGLELFASERKRKPLPRTGSNKKTEALVKLGIVSVQDMLQHYPRRHIDRTKLRTIRELSELAAAGELEPEVTIHARVAQIGRPFQIGNRTGGKRKTMIKGRIADETGSLEVTWFNQDWVARALPKDAQAFFYGRLSEFRGKLQMTAPRFEVVKTGAEPFNVGRIIPIYPATADMSSDQLRKVMWETFESVEQVLDPLPDEMRRVSD